ncbi:deoxyribonuclease-1 isoform X1 [Micropterus salmoides]|uniref:deoxyribonuclease-1 isoform X1 n=1 Tax=Micropterus salmoides TaxID=27706 RepID=UPI0018ED0BA2|nr:deoxyribonuclease-1 isoform X1 [Micropterus salmoides]
MRLVGTLVLFLALLHLSASLLLGAFNIRSFGDKKSSNTTLMNIISTIVHRYDIILIQEVRDCDLSATKRLMQHINKLKQTTHSYASPQFRYSHIVSEPLGRSSYKERYLFLYREQTVSMAKNYTYDDGCEPCGTDTFNREPFVVMFSSKNTAVKNFVLIPQHTSPDFAVKEVNALYDVVADVRTRWNTNDIVLLGDFNAGCSYVTGSEWQQIRLFTDKSFHWLITNEADSTVSHTKCPYDRIVVTTDMVRGVVHGSARVYDYMMDLNLSQNLALAVSDHFPVEMKLIGQAPAA